MIFREKEGACTTMNKPAGAFRSIGRPQTRDIVPSWEASELTVAESYFLKHCFRNMTERPEIDWNSLCKDVKIRNRKSAIEKFWKVAAKLRPKFLVGDEAVGTNGKSPAVPGIVTRSSAAQPQTTEEPKADPGTNCPMDESPQIGHCVDEEYYAVPFSDEDDIDSIYSESEYLARFQQALVNSAGTKIKLEEDLDMDMYEDNWE
jgi:hypothetical protein